jgi:hypothetical protein
VIKATRRTASIVNLLKKSTVDQTASQNALPPTKSVYCRTIPVTAAAAMNALAMRATDSQRTPIDRLLLALLDVGIRGPRKMTADDFSEPI